MIACLSVGFLLLLFQTGEKGSDLAYTNHFDFETKWIVILLGILILSTLTEVFRHWLVSLSAMLGVIATAIVVPEATLLLATAAYGMLSDSSMEHIVASYYHKDRARNAVQYVLRIRQVWLRIILVVAGVVTICVQRQFYLLILLAVAVVLACKTVSMYEHDRMLTEKFDQMRFDARKSRQLREEVSHNIDMQVQNATLAERNRIAREIHDNVGHMLTRAVVQLQAISVINQDEQTKPYIESVSNTVNEAMTNIRRSVHELHDDSIDLSIGIHEIASILKEKFDVNVSTSIESPVPNLIKNAILGIVKEGVTNIAKYSNGRNVRLEVVENVTFWRVLIFDDGQSEPLELSRSSDFAALDGEHGIGLSNIYSRVKSCDGRVTIQGGKHGFNITVTIPKKQV